MALRRGLAEFVDVIGAVRPQLVKKRGLDASAVVDWVRLARDHAPSSIEELTRFEETEKARKVADRAQKSPWELLGIEWDDYHPGARQILDDPFFWDLANEYAPNGNDTGADLLHDARLSRVARQNPIKFLDSLIARWGMKDMVEVALTRPGTALTSDDELAIVTYDEAAIALPFALVKLYGAADIATIDLALSAVERERDVGEMCGWPMPQERKNALQKIERKLRQLRAG